MGSLWQLPLPLEEHRTSRVAIYFYSDRWIPISFSRLADAIELHQKALHSGKELLVFPPNLDPESFDAELTKSYCYKLSSEEISTHLTNLRDTEGSKGMYSRLYSN